MLRFFKNMLGASVASALCCSLTIAPVAASPTAATSSSNAPAAAARGVDGFGKADSKFDGMPASDIYQAGYYCDTSVRAYSTSGCEVGASGTNPPARSYDYLYITVPMGFAVPPMQMNCPMGLVCIDHPATLDMSRVGGPRNAPAPGHDHFVERTVGGYPIWWQVKVFGVTSRATYDAIEAHGSVAYIRSLIAKHDPTVMKEAPTNIFLFFAVASRLQ